MSAARLKNIGPLIVGSLLAFAAYLSQRPAPLRNAKITTVTPGRPPIAHVSLKYGRGSLPASVIVDVYQPGSAGSATLAHGQLFVEIPLAPATTQHAQVTTTATYRVLGHSHNMTQNFR